MTINKYAEISELFGVTNPVGRISLMENGGDIQMSFAANNERKFQRMRGLLDGIGEAI